MPRAAMSGRKTSRDICPIKKKRRAETVEKIPVGLARRAFEISRNIPHFETKTR